MKTKGIKKTKVNIVTLGCSKNLVDSEVLLTQLRGNGIDVIHESKKDDANIVVINTPNGILVARKDLSQKVKDAVARIKEDQIK